MTGRIISLTFIYPLIMLLAGSVYFAPGSAGLERPALNDEQGSGGVAVGASATAAHFWDAAALLPASEKDKYSSSDRVSVSADEAQAALRSVDQGLAFIENRGQWSSEVLYRARLGGASIWVLEDGLVYDFFEASEAERDELQQREADAASTLDFREPEATRRGHIVAMRFEGAQADRAVGHGQKDAYHNYFSGQPAQWTSHVPVYEEVVLEGLYEGIDLRLYDDGGLPRYDLVLAPGADLAEVRMRLEGADGVTLTPEGALRMETALGPVEQRELLAYQEDAKGLREEVESAFLIAEDRTVRFSAAGADPTRPLVVDPLLYSTFLGSSQNEYINAVAVSENGTVTVAGGTASTYFPTTTGAYDTNHNGHVDVFVAKFRFDGQGAADLVYSTFFGGSDRDVAEALDIDDSGYATVGGLTRSSNFPTTDGAYDRTYNGGNADAFVARLSDDGSDLIYSTYFGGGGGDANDYVEDLAVGSDGRVTLVGYTSSSAFPTTPGVFQEDHNGEDDAFVAKIRCDGTGSNDLIYSTYLGGTFDDRARAMALDLDGSVIVAGGTASTFPTTEGAYDRSRNGGFYDAFVTRLSSDGSELLYSTLLGGSGNYDVARSVAIDVDGRVTVAGSTDSPDFPTTSGAYDELHNQYWDGFITRLNADGSSLVYSTYLGGADDAEYLRGMVLGADGSATVVGYTFAADFPTTSGSHDEDHNGLEDAFVARVSHDGADLLYSTFLGGEDYDRAFAVAMDEDGNAVVAGQTRSTDFPTTAGAYNESHGGFTLNSDAFLTRVDVGTSDVNQAPVITDATVPSDPLAVGSAVQVSAAFTDDDDSGDLTCTIDYGDNTVIAGTISGSAPDYGCTDDTYAYSVAGSYTVTFTVTDSEGQSDSHEAAEDIVVYANEAPEITQVTVPEDPVAVEAAMEVSATFTDDGAVSGLTCLIDYGDGSVATGTIAGTAPDYTCTDDTHSYAEAGIYTVSATVTDDHGENDTMEAAQYVVVYDPSAGFVSGSGWIDSPQGAFADPELSDVTGRARFGFTARYRRGQPFPDGNTQFRFRAADFSFRSTEYQWLVVAGQQGKFKGYGEVNGGGNYGFMLTAIDGQLSGGSDEDAFRIKIWDRDDNDAVVYDNEMGQDEDSGAATTLRGGNIRINVTGGSKMVAGEDRPEDFELNAAYPNPFRMTTKLEFALPQATDVEIIVFDVLGREVARLADREYGEGRHTVQFDGAGLAPGLYLARLRVGTLQQIQRLTLMR